MPKLFIGIDPSAERFAVSTYHRPEAPEQATNGFTNDFDGFEALTQWLAHQGASPEMSIVCVETTLAHQGASPEMSIVCVETTGVYAEALCYYLHEHTSGTSVKKPSKSRGYGLPVLRKLVYLAGSPATFCYAAYNHL